MHDDVLNLLPSRDLDDCRELLHVGVHATGRDEAHEVEGPAAAHGCACRPERPIAEERSVLDRVVDAHELLVLDVAGAHREMPDLAVSHHAVWEADIAATRAQDRVRIGLEQRAETRRLRPRHGVRGGIRCDAPSIEHAQDDRSRRSLPRAVQANARTTAANSSASSDAPPTSAPSIPSASANSPTEPEPKL